MNCSHAFRVLIGLIILLSIVWKLMIRSNSPDDLGVRLVVFFEHNKFDIIARDLMLDADQTATSVPVIEAAKDACHLFVSRLNSNGSNEDLIRFNLSGMERLFFVSHGNVYMKNPTLLTATGYIWFRFFKLVGLSDNSAPTFAVRANSSCAAENIPWAELSRNFSPQSTIRVASSPLRFTSSNRGLLMGP